MVNINPIPNHPQFDNCLRLVPENWVSLLGGPIAIHGFAKRCKEEERKRKRKGKGKGKQKRKSLGRAKEKDIKRNGKGKEEERERKGKE